jgi:hypothetical protein
MYYGMKNILKNNYNHTFKQTLNQMVAFKAMIKSS